ncbi:MAG: hypothetical protein IPL54_08910 [Chitinophagaceae bacterium]|nr:hypothetical protein [Chitinophagaceae bacterium]
MNIFALTQSQFNKKYPELKGRKLNNTPEDKPYRDAFKSILKKNKKTKSNQAKKANSAVHSCPNKHATQNRNSTTCKANLLEVTKEKGTYTLKIPGTNLDFQEKKYKNITILEIVSGPKNKPVQISINAKGTVGPCTQTHKNKTFNYTKEDLTVENETDSSFKAKVFSKELSKLFTLKAIYQTLSVFFSQQSNVLTYPINYTTCGFQKSVDIKVYPDLSFNSSIAINYETKYSKKGEKLESDTDKDSTAKLLGQRLQFSLDLKHDGITLAEFKQKQEEDDDDGPEFIKFLETFFDTLDYLNKGFSFFFRDSQELKLSFKPSLSTSFKLKEIPGTPFVGNELSVTVGFSPLFGLDATADVSGVLLKSVPVLGAFVAALEAIEMADVFLGFIIKGECSLEGTFSKFAQKNKFEKNKVEFKGSVKINLQGHVKSEKKVWRIKWSVGVKIGAQSGFEIEETTIEYDSKGVYIPLVINFLGITCYEQAWINLGISAESNSVPGFTKQQEFSGFGSNEEEDLDNISDGHKYEIIPPRVMWDKRIYL